jgi:hypothetical protein
MRKCNWEILELENWEFEIQKSLQIGNFYTIIALMPPFHVISRSQLLVWWVGAEWIQVKNRSCFENPGGK